MKHNYVILSDDKHDLAETKAVAAAFKDLNLLGTATTYADGLDLILEKQPDLVFLEIEPSDPSSGLCIQLINEVHRYLTKVPEFIITAKSTEKAYEVLKYQVLDYLVAPFRSLELRKALLLLDKKSRTAHPKPDVFEPLVATAELPDQDEVIPQIELPMVMDPLPAVAIEAKPLIICVKSYGDYRFLEASNIAYLQADNNSTDIHLNNGEMITAFKTLKHFETVLPSPFVRIHNSYIVNMDYVSRIHTGNSVCYIKNSTTKLPFSKSYKDNVDNIINSISMGNYLEI